MQTKTVAQRIFEKLFKVGSVGIKIDQEQLQDSLLVTREQISEELDKVEIELKDIKAKCEKLNEEAKKLFEGIDKGEELLNQVRGTPAEAKYAKNIQRWQDNAWAAIRQGVKEEDQVLMKRKYALQARRTQLLKKLSNLG